MANKSTSLEDFEREILQAPRPAYNAQLRLYDVFIPTLGSLIILLNLMVVLSSGLILRKRQQPRSTYIFLGNIALADMMTGVVTLFGQYYPKDERDEMICCFQIGLIVASTMASIYSIALIAIDRFLYILYGLQYQRYLATKRARLMVLATWVLGGIVGFLPAMGVRNSTNNGKFCWLIILEPTALILSTVTIGAIPLCLIITLYGIILKQALGKITEMQYSETAVRVPSCNIERPNQLRYFRGGSRQSNTSSGHPARESSVRSYSGGVSYIQEESAVEDRARARRSIFNCCRSRGTLSVSSVYSPSRWKAIKIVLFTTGCFFFTWFPYFFACALYATCDPEENPHYCNNLRIAIASPLAILGLANSLLNPIIYAWWHNGFRESTKKIYNNIWRQRVRPQLDCFIKERTTMGASSRRTNMQEEESITKSTETSRITVSDIERTDAEQAECSETQIQESPLVLVVSEAVLKTN